MAPDRMEHDKPSQTSDLTLPCLIHDLNNVFQTLVDAADLLSTDPRWAALSAAMLRSIERGKGITESLQASEHAAGAFETILQNAIAFVEDSLVAGRRPGIRFACDVEPGLELRRNWAWERVLINLFSNAVRAMPQGGTIHVSARRRDDQIEIVNDIFKQHISTKSEGGLGLHIVETIVKQDEGQVRASNRPDGRGAEFTITLPAEQALARPTHA